MTGFSDPQKLPQSHEADVTVQQWLTAIPDAKQALVADTDSLLSDGSTLVPRDLPERYNKSWRRCLSLLPCGGEFSRLSPEPGTELDPHDEKLHAPEKLQTTPEATNCCLPKRRLARAEGATGRMDPRDTDSDCDTPNKRRQLTSDHFSSRLAPRSRVPEHLVHGDQHRHWDKSGSGENESGRAADRSCCALHERSRLAPVKPCHYHVGFEWPSEPRDDDRGTIMLCIPTSYEYFDPDNMSFQNSKGVLKSEQSDHLLVTVLGTLEGFDETLFKENDWDYPFPFPQKLTERIKEITDKWYAEYSEEGSGCSAEKAAWVKDRLAQGFDLPGILRNNLIEVDTGAGGIYYNRFRARNWLAEGDKGGHYTLGAEGTLTGEEPMMPTRDHICKITMSKNWRLHKTDDPLTGMSEIMITPVITLCNGAERGLEPDDPRMAVFDTEQNRVFNAPKMRAHLLRVQGAERCGLTPVLLEEADAATQSAFDKLDLHDCEALQQYPECRTRILIRTKHLRTEILNQEDFLDDARIQLEERLSDVEHVLHEPVVRNAVEEMFSQLGSTPPPGSTYAEWGYALDRAAGALVSNFGRKSLLMTGNQGWSQITRDEASPRCEWNVELLESERVPEGRRQGEYFGERADPGYYISVYGHIRPSAIPNDQFTRNDNSNTRSYIPVERGRVIKSTVVLDLVLGRLLSARASQANGMDPAQSRAYPVSGPLASVAETYAWVEDAWDDILIQQPRATTAQHGAKLEELASMLIERCVGETG